MSGATRGLLLASSCSAAAALACVATAASGQRAGGQIAFVRQASGSGVFVVRTDGSRPRRLTRTGTASDPAWSRDGSRLAYVSTRCGDAELYVAGADGGNVRRLTTNRVEDALPTWSPDGRRLAFASNRTGAFEIWVANADGTGVRRVTRGATRAHFNVFPAWSPAGEWIAFASSVGTTENQEIYVVRADGSGRARVARTPGDVHRVGDDATPSWSPDGRRIAYANNRTGDLQIWMRADGRGQRLLAGVKGRDDDRPSFSPDGRRIVFSSLGPSGRSAVYVVGADGTRLRRLVDGHSPAWRP